MTQPTQLNLSTSHIQPIPAFADNYVWLIHAGGKQPAVVIDPGTSAPVETVLKQQDWNLGAILLTHHHADHCGGVESLRAPRPYLPVYGPSLERIAGVNHPLQGGETLHLPMLPEPLTVISVPGHTRGHIAYLYPDLPDAPALFCGDTLFAAGCGRVFDGTATQLFTSLQSLAALPAHTRIFCAHEYTLSNLAFACQVEPQSAALQARRQGAQKLRAQGQPTVPSTLALELATNPFLRCHLPHIQASAEDWRARHAADLPTVCDPETTFIALRAWKNSLRG